MSKKPETLKIVYTEGGYAVFIYPSPQPVAVFQSGLELLDWVARHIADWEGRREDAPRPREEKGDTAEARKTRDSDQDDAQEVS